MSQQLDYYKKLILDHNREPRNYGSGIEGVSHSAEGYNKLCGDKIQVFLRVVEDLVEDISFETQACALCKASASMMTERVKGKHLQELGQLNQVFEGLFDKEGEVDPEVKNMLGELVVFESVSAYPARVKCVKLPWNTLLKAIDKQPETVDE